MNGEAPHFNHLSEFLKYLASIEKSDGDRLPSLSELSRQLGVCVASLREQLEAARVLGLVEAKPRIGMRRLPYSFHPAVRQSLAYAVAIDPGNFKAYSDLRKHIEAAYWYQAVGLLTAEDQDILRELVSTAQAKLNSQPVQIPHREHRSLHMTIYRRLNNPFVLGLLEAYWDLYEEAGLDVYPEYSYLVQVWNYHQKMVEGICRGDFDSGYQSLNDHVDLLFQRSKPSLRQRFE